LLHDCRRIGSGGLSAAEIGLNQENDDVRGDR
jgi:hypothetical protein